MEGYKTSTDYKMLWRLIRKGIRIPAWIVYTREFPEPIFDLVEVKVMHGKYSIGTRGRGYDTLTDTVESFSDLCQSLELRFIEPFKTPDKSVADQSCSFTQDDIEKSIEFGFWLNKLETSENLIRKQQEFIQNLIGENNTTT